ncbi:hypothetical protein ABB37_03493 [Leptomonas pyrrhocoris]|uniref:Uncharacterized protein n=1 Tax=Leptomonas pyrrhocoris TaxID=157538 RepID=A0A0N0VG25_LEPPY|nr:hypothetical protein ABB37_03493 [Leptomonas pyrrhocoris]KPA82421.1 hypothetical protein ABB37_03493 [Leptomonas pyrrhocoris]|eukprot:XP_015660860.1 hypothetical protein ABB37_03493 [Leptomonas pyrrhocoris]
MEAFRQKQVRCRTTLASGVAKDQNGHTLRSFHAPTRGGERESEALADNDRYAGLLKLHGSTVINYSPLQYIQKMTSETLTDVEAERVVYPFCASAVTAPFEQVLLALIDKLRSTVGAVSWNRPVAHAEWETDLRFWGQWWLVLRSREETGRTLSSADQHPSGRRSRVSWVHGMHNEPLVPLSTKALLTRLHDDKEENRYAPLLRRGAGTTEENQLIADLAKRLTGPTDHFDIFHLSGVRMAPDRMHVLFFDGFFKLASIPSRKAAAAAAQCERDEAREGSSLTSAAAVHSKGNAASGEEAEETLSTLSFSSCQMGSAGVVVLLTGIAALAGQGMSSISSLDLSYNALQSCVLYSFSQMLRFTFVKRLSLRGNNLASVDVIPFREFLLEGCERQVEELDLSYTELTPTQIAVLIEALPRLSRMRVLLLEEVTIPGSKWPSLVRAVERTQLWHLRLVSSNAVFSTATAPPPFSSIAFYVKSIEEVCARNAQRAAEASGAAAAAAARNGFFGLNGASFFEAFFLFSQLKGCRMGEGESALPGDYTAFTTNDPSLV